MYQMPIAFGSKNPYYGRNSFSGGTGMSNLMHIPPSHYSSSKDPNANAVLTRQYQDIRLQNSSSNNEKNWIQHEGETMKSEKEKDVRWKGYPFRGSQLSTAVTTTKSSASGASKKSGKSVKKKRPKTEMSRQTLMMPQPPPVIPMKKIIHVHRGITQFPTAIGGQQSIFINSFVDVKELENPPNLGNDWPGNDTRHRFMVDMTGFKNEEITFFLQGRILIVQGIHMNKDYEEVKTNERRVTEAIELPLDVEGDNLRVARDERGILYLEEAWKY